MIKKVILILLIMSPLGLTLYNDSENGPYNKEINKINEARIYEQNNQNEDGMKEADRKIEQVKSQRNYENQFIVSLFLPLIVLLLGSIFSDNKDNKRKNNFKKRKLGLLKVKVNKYFSIIEKSNETSNINNIECLKEIEFYFLDYYNSKDIELTEDQIQLSKDIVSDLTILINFGEYGDTNIAELNKDLCRFIKNELRIKNWCFLKFNSWKPKPKTFVFETNG